MTSRARMLNSSSVMVDFIWSGFVFVWKSVFEAASVGTDFPVFLCDFLFVVLFLIFVGCFTELTVEFTVVGDFDVLLIFL